LTVRITASRHTAFYSPLICTMAAGFLEKHNLEYTYGVLPPGETAAGMIRSGKTDVMQSAPSTNWAKMEKGETDFPLNFALINQRDGFFLFRRGKEFAWKDLEGKTLLADLDVVADAGASRTADVKVFPDIRPGPDGVLHLEFAGEDGMPAMVSAIEILPGAQGHMRPVRVLARQSAYYSNDSHWWSPDDYFEGGQLAVYAEPVTGTDDPELYETERWGNFSYAIPASPGRYSITLHFAARRATSGRSS